MNNLVKLLLVYCLSATIAKADTDFDKIVDCEFGVSATNAKLAQLANKYPSEPPYSKTGKSFLTLNKFGFDISTSDTIKNNWLVRDFLAFCDTDSTVLDIGGGYGAITQKALDTGATVVYNDLDFRHLLIGFNRMKIRDKSKLILNSKKIPDTLSFKANTFNAIMLHKVLHYLTPDDVEASLIKLKQFLKPKGRLYIAVMSPNHRLFNNELKKDYARRWFHGSHWPGFPIKVQHFLPHLAYNLPDYIHVMDDKPLRQFLSKQGMVIENYDFIANNNISQGRGHVTPQECFGLIASKE